MLHFLYSTVPQKVMNLRSYNINIDSLAPFSSVRFVRTTTPAEEGPWTAPTLSITCVLNVTPHPHHDSIMDGQWYEHFSNILSLLDWILKRLHEKLLNSFPQNLDGEWVSVHNRPHSLWVQIWTMGHNQEFLPPTFSSFISEGLMRRFCWTTSGVSGWGTSSTECLSCVCYIFDR